MMSDQQQVRARSYAEKAHMRKFKLPNTLRLIGLKNFFWIIVVGGGVLSLHLFGTPHILFQYQYAGSKSSKINCTYIGLHTQTISASGGVCPAVTFLHSSR